MKNIRLISTLFSAIVLQACGGGGDTPSSGLATNTTNGAIASSTSPPASVTSNSSVSSNPASAASAAFVAKSAIGIALQNGLYAVSYGNYPEDGKLDRSIWKTTLNTSSSGVHELLTDNYAGNNSSGLSPLGYVHWGLYVPGQSDEIDPKKLRLDDDAGSIIGDYDVSLNQEKSYIWKVDATPIDIAGSSIKDFLANNRSRSWPQQSSPNTNAVFPADAKGFRLSYTVEEDVFFVGQLNYTYTNKSDFETRYHCSSRELRRLAYRALPNGTLSIYEIGFDTACDENIEKEKFLGSGHWFRKQGPSFEYYEIDFPPEIPYSQFDSEFSQLDYSNGVRAISTIPVAGRYTNGYRIPANVKFESINLSLNKQAADAIKSAVPM